MLTLAGMAIERLPISELATYKIVALSATKALELSLCQLHDTPTAFVFHLVQSAAIRADTECNPLLPSNLRIGKASAPTHGALKMDPLGES